MCVALIYSDYLWAGSATPPPVGTPSAGSIMRQIEQLQPQTQLPTEPKKESSPKVTKESVTKVTVKGFKFQGNKLISNEVLQQFVKKYIGKNLTIEDLQNIAAEIGGFYRDSGYLAVAGLPKQDVTEGIITIDIQESHFGGVLLPDSIKKNLHRVTPATIENFVGHDMNIGDPLELKKVDRALLITSDLPGVETKGNLVPGNKEGQTDIAVDARDKPLVYGDATVDNWGSRTTGQNRILSDLMIASPLGIGDLVSFSGLYTAGSKFGRMEYSLPVGYDGWRLGVNSSHLNYHLITADFASTQPMGMLTTYGLDTTYPIIRSQSHNLSFSGTYDYKYFSNLYLGTSGYTPSSQYDIQVYNLGLTDVETDSWVGGGTTVSSVTWGIGNVNLNNSANFQSDSLNAQTNGSYQRLRLGINRTQNIVENYSLFASIQGQFASKNLDPSEKLYLGGPTGVRAYPLSEGGGDIGYIESVELRRQLGQHWQLAGFVDSGMIAQNKNNYTTSGTPINAVNAYHLNGYGLMTTYSGPYQSVWKLIWSHRIGGNPNPTTTGLDQAGSLIYNQFWMSAMLPF